MGNCTSNNQQSKKKNVKGKVKAKVKGKTQEEEEIVKKDVKPEVLKKDVIKLYKSNNDKREKLKVDCRPLLSERRGLNACIDEERERLNTLLLQKDELEKQREVLMNKTWAQDVDDIHKAYEMKDKPTLTNIIVSRTKWQLDIIRVMYQKKYNEEIYERLATDGQNLIGKLFTGSQTNLCNILIYRIMPQPERDAAFLRDFTQGMSNQDENILEIVMTRSNLELRFAQESYNETYKSNFKDIISKNSYKNYREFMLLVLECRRDEENCPLEPEKAAAYAKRLYDAGAGKTIGTDVKPFIEIFSKLSKAQFDSINEVYKGRQLQKDIESRLGGDLAKALKIRCMDKYKYLAWRLSKAFASSFSVDKGCIARILGCLARWECVKLREAYDHQAAVKGGGKTLEFELKKVIVTEPNFLRACLSLIMGDKSLTPLGSDAEAGEDEMAIQKGGTRAREAAEQKYRKKEFFERGEEIEKERKKKKPPPKKRPGNAKPDKEKGSGDEKDVEGAKDKGVKSNGGKGKNGKAKGKGTPNGKSKKQSAVDEEKVDDEDDEPKDHPNPTHEGQGGLAHVAEEDEETEIPRFVLDGRTRGNDPIQLTAALREAQEVSRQLTSFEADLVSEVAEKKNTYIALTAHVYEADSWIALLNGHVACLKSFNDRRDRLHVISNFVSRRKSHKEEETDN